MSWKAFHDTRAIPSDEELVRMIREAVECLRLVEKIYGETFVTRHLHASHRALVNAAMDRGIPVDDATEAPSARD